MRSLRLLAVAFIATVLPWLGSTPLAAAELAAGSSPPLAIGSTQADSGERTTSACTPVIGVNPDPVEFGEVEVGQVGIVDVTLTDEEAGGPPCGITITNVQITQGAVAFELSGLPNFPITIPSDGSFTFQVRFSPPVEAQMQGLMVISSDDANTPEREVILRGTGVAQGNELPICNAGGPYSGTINEPVNFDGTASTDPDGTIATYAWDFGDGSSGTGATPSHTYTSPGVFTVTLTVTDNDGAMSNPCQTGATIAESLESITVTAPNGGEEFSPGETTQVTWTTDGVVPLVDIELSTDGGSTFAAIAVDETNDGAFDWLVMNQPTVQALIKVSDAGDGVPADQSNAFFTINGVQVTRPNGGENFFIGTVEAITWNSFGTEITDVTIQYSTDDGQNWLEVAASTPNDASFEWTVPAPMTLAARVRIYPAGNLLAADISDGVFNILEVGGPIPPTCDAGGPYSGTVNLPVAFDGTASTDIDGTIVSYAWDFGDGSTDTGPTPTHTYTGPGDFTVMLTVTDDDVLSSKCQTTASITPPNQTPTCDAGGPYSGGVNVPVSFDGSGSTDPDGTIVTYAWDFGDGNTGTGSTPSHTYAGAGTFTVTLTVTDDDGGQSGCGTTAEITGEGNQSPTCDADGPYAGAVGMPITFDGSDSDDPDGTIVTYAWTFGDGATGSGVSPNHTYTAGGVYDVTLIVTDNDGASSGQCTTTATVVEVPPGGVRAALPPRTFGAPEADVAVPIIMLDDVTGLGILSTEISIAYDPRVLTAKGVSLVGTIGQGGTFEWDIEEISDDEEIVRLSVAWVQPIEGCDELAFIIFRSGRDPERDQSVLDLEIVFNEGTPPVIAQDGEFIKGLPGDANCSSNVSPSDASLQLQITVGSIHLGDPHYPCLTVEQADVSGNDEITAFDASLVLRFVLGLIGKFPVEENIGCKFGFAGGRGGDPLAQASAAGSAPRAARLTASPPRGDGSFDLTVTTDDLSEVFGGDFELGFDSSVLRVVEVIPLLAGDRALAESEIAEGTIRLAVALADDRGPGLAEVARIRFAPVGLPAEGATSIEFVRAELNEGAIHATASGIKVPRSGGSPSGEDVRVTVPERIFAGHDSDVLVPIFLLDDVTGRGILSTQIVLGYDREVVRGIDADLAGTIGEGGSYEFNLVRVDEDREEVHLSIIWVEPIAGCGTLVNVVMHTSRDLHEGPVMSPLDLDIAFNEGEPGTDPTSGVLVRAVLGDVNGSRNLSSLDASLILNSVVGMIEIPDPHYPNLVLEIADVSGNQEIRAFDAALVLQRVLGIIDHFPVEESLECGDGARVPPLAAGTRSRNLSLVWLGEKAGILEAALMLDDGAQVLAAEATLAFDPALLRAIEVMGTGEAGTSLVASRLAEGRIELASALGRDGAGETRFVVIRFERLGRGENEVRIERASLNEGAIPVTVQGAGVAGAPGIGRVVLGQNRPNPFNPATEITFGIPSAGEVHLAVYDLSGRLVRALVEGVAAAGEHVARWDGRDDHGRPVAAGVYLCALEAQGATTTRKMILVR